MATPVKTTPQRPVARPTANPQRTGERAPQNRRMVQKHATVKPFNMPFENTNIAIILAGVGVIALSYLLMYLPDTLSPIAITVAPIVFVIGYCVIVPMGIMAGRGEKKDQNTQKTP